MIDRIPRLLHHLKQHRLHTNAMLSVGETEHGQTMKKHHTEIEALRGLLSEAAFKELDRTAKKEIGKKKAPTAEFVEYSRPFVERKKKGKRKAG